MLLVKILLLVTVLHAVAAQRIQCYRCIGKTDDASGNCVSNLKHVRLTNCNKSCVIVTLAGSVLRACLTDAFCEDIRNSGGVCELCTEDKCNNGIIDENGKITCKKF